MGLRMPGAGAVVGRIEYGSKVVVVVPPQLVPPFASTSAAGLDGAEGFTSAQAPRAIAPATSATNDGRNEDTENLDRVNARGERTAGSVGLSTGSLGAKK